MSESVSFWANQSKVTEPGEKGRQAIAELLSTLESPPTIASLRRASSYLVFHYMAGDFAAASVPVERKQEIDSRTSTVMFEILLSRKPSLCHDRKPIDRVVGCCRDATVLFLSLARAAGIPARARSGFAGYLRPGWYMDHVVAEVWDAEKQQWLLVDPEMNEDWKPSVNGVTVDWNNLTQDQFITAPRAWAGLKNGSLAIDPEKFVIAPPIQIPVLKGYAYIAHNVMHDLAMLNMVEMLLWDSWNLGFRKDYTGGPLPAEDDELVQRVCAVTESVGSNADAVRELFKQEGIAVPNLVYSSNVLNVDGDGRLVDVSHLLN